MCMWLIKSDSAAMLTQIPTFSRRPPVDFEDHPLLVRTVANRNIPYPPYLTSPSDAKRAGWLHRSLTRMLNSSVRRLWPVI